MVYGASAGNSGQQYDDDGWDDDNSSLSASGGEGGGYSTQFTGMEFIIPLYTPPYQGLVLCEYLIHKDGIENKNENNNMNNNYNQNRGGALMKSRVNEGLPRAHENMRDCRRHGCSFVLY